MANKAFEFIKAPPLSGGTDYVPLPDPPEGRPVWITVLAIVFGLSALSGLGMLAASYWAARAPLTPVVAGLEAQTTPIDWHGQQLIDPFPMLESAFDPNLGNPPELQSWLDKQRLAYDTEYVQSPGYAAWEKWYYDQQATRPLELLYLATGASNSWWLTSSNDAEYAVRSAPTFTAAEQGTIHWESSRWNMPFQPDAVYPSPDGKRAMLGFSATISLDPGELLLVDPALAESKWVRLSCIPNSRVAWLPDASGFWYDAPSGTENVADHTLYQLDGVGGVSTNPPATARTLMGPSDDGAWLLYGQSAGDDTLTVEIRSNSAALETPLTSLWSLDGDRAWGDIPGGANPNAYLIVQTVATATYRLMSVPLSGGEPVTLNEFLPGRPLRLEVGESSIALLSDDAQGWVCFRYDLQGKNLQTLELGPEWDVSAYSYPTAGKAARIGMSGITSSWRICDFDPDTGVLSTLSNNASTFTHAKPDVQLLEIKAHDGTLLRATIIRPRRPSSRELPRPTILYANGSGNAATDLGLSYVIGPWVDAGGVWVSTEVRGSGDHDAAWIAAGKGEKKAQAVEDVLTVARELVADGITTTSQLVLFGEKHGGWLMSQAGMTEPDTINGVIAIAPVTDLTRITQTGTSTWWRDEFGNPGDPATLAYLPSLSPFHMLDAVGTFPAFFLAAAEDDTYIAPWQTFKFAAGLQHKCLTEGPCEPVVAVLTPTGGNQLLHGSDEDWELMTSLLLFAGNQTGLTPSF